MADRSIVLRCSNCGSPQYEWSAGRPAGAIPDFGKLQTHPCHVCGEAVNWALFANDKYHALLAEDCIGLMTAEQNLNLLLIRAVAEGVDPGPVPICPSSIWTAALNLEIERAMGAHKPRIVVPVVVAGRPVGAPVRRGVSHKHVIVVPVVVAPGWSKALQRLPGALVAAVLVLGIVSRMDWSESRHPRPATKPCEVAGARNTRVTGNAALRVSPDILAEVRADLYRDDEVSILESERSESSFKAQWGDPWKPRRMHRERYESSWRPVCCIRNGKLVSGWVHADYLR